MASSNGLGSLSRPFSGRNGRLREYCVEFGRPFSNQNGQLRRIAQNRSTIYRSKWSTQEYGAVPVDHLPLQTVNSRVPAQPGRPFSNQNGRLKEDGAMVYIYRLNMVTARRSTGGRVSVDHLPIEMVNSGGSRRLGRPFPL
ncbi:MAG: hypothetical protein U5K84_07030 [Alkalibacterium sp.]|nr:hypothetical protein [Alkalibacterium sp.]